MLAHLSENNNHPDIARTCAEKALEPRRSLLHTQTLYLATQESHLKPILV